MKTNEKKPSKQEKLRANQGALVEVFCGKEKREGADQRRHVVRKEKVSK